MNKTKIETFDCTFNPITGCFNDCPYCYARRIVQRFARQGDEHCHDCTQPPLPLHEKRYKRGYMWTYGFQPTLHSYRLLEPAQKRKPKNIFVCSMADLFGGWVPDEWIQRVFDACIKAPQHRYLFLTKNPKRYQDLFENGIIKKGSDFWFGTTITNDSEPYMSAVNFNCYLSIEPIGKFDSFHYDPFDGEIKWVIIGAETGNRKDKVIPKREWITNIVDTCKHFRIPTFMKSNLASIWGEPLIQEFPW